ncbi:hypothetical protein HYW87_01790 [Candidatus Roizmanbacteria bacterium]|nr:hypothetical protein [Candidatus Roizmanbacteria bacterium]
MLELVNNVVWNFLQRLFNYFPNLLSGIIILVVGLVLSGILKRVLLSVFSFIRLDVLLHRMRLLDKNEVHIWEEVLAEVLRWTVVILFLIPTLEVLGLSRATIVLNQFLLYLPNVIVAVVIAFVGIIASNLGADLIRHSVRTIGATSANTLAVFTKWLISFFTILVVLNQLGVAQDLIRILFTGIIAMVAIAGGLAFGLGGQGLAKDILEELRKNLSSRSPK